MAHVAKHQRLLFQCSQRRIDITKILSVAIGGLKPFKIDQDQVFWAFRDGGDLGVDQHGRKIGYALICPYRVQKFPRHALMQWIEAKQQPRRQHQAYSPEWQQPQQREGAVAQNQQ